MTATGAQSNHLRAEVASGDPLDVRQYAVHDRMSALFQVSLVVHAENANIDFDAVAGKPATFTMVRSGEPRFWSGVCNHLQQIRVEEGGLCTYEISIVPSLWFAGQRRNHRMFQQMSEPDIVLQMLKEWGVEPEVRIDQGAYKKRKYRVQYGESDLAFISRMLEDAGVSFYFEQQGAENKLVLSDSPQKNAPRPNAIPYLDKPSEGAARKEHATAVRIGQQVRPGKVTLRDHDYRLAPSYKLMASATGGDGVEGRLERFHYTPGAFLFGTDKGEVTPHADDRGKSRTDEGEAANLAQKRLDAERGSARVVSFETNVLDLMPGMVMRIEDHPRAELGKTLLVVEVRMEGASQGDSSCHCETRSADQAYRPPLVTPRPTTQGVESATVVGPAGEEIHTDEFGRVRCHFHWDRESEMNEKSSCWIHVSQPWGGTGYGGSNLPRIGQEVIVDFLGGDPDRPVITGRVYTNLQKTPYKLPDNKTQSGWKSNSTNKTGGYNEIMFEDSAGKELVRMQAEKDQHQLIKHDEDVIVGHDRTELVKHDETLTVDNDRTRQVGHDETLTVGHDRTRLVGNDESITIGNNRTQSIALNEAMFVGANQTEEIGADRTLLVGGNDVEKVGKNRSVSVGLGNSEAVGLGSSESVGTDKTLTVGAAYTIIVGGSMSTSVGGSQSESVGSTKTVTAGDKITFTCGASTIVMDSGGNISVSGTDISVTATGTVNVNAGGVVNVKSGATVNVKGTTIAMN